MTNLETRATMGCLQTGATLTIWNGRGLQEKCAHWDRRAGASEARVVMEFQAMYVTNDMSISHLYSVLLSSSVLLLVNVRVLG